MSDTSLPPLKPTSSVVSHCLACRQTIELGATKCPHCSEYQSRRRHLHNGSLVLSLVVAVLTSAALLVSEWDRFTPKDSRIEIAVQRLAVGEGSVGYNGAFQLILERDGPQLWQPANYVWAITTVSNTGHRDGLIRELGGDVPTPDFVRDLQTGEGALFPMVIEPGKTRLLAVSVGFVRTNAMLDASDDQLRSMIRNAPKEAAGRSVPDGHGRGLHVIEDGVDLVIADVQVTYMDHSGILSERSIPIPESVVLSGLQSGREQGRWTRENVPPPPEESGSD